MKILLNLIILFLIIIQTQGQVILTNKQSGSNNLTYEIEIPNQYSQDELNKNKKIVFKNFKDESKPGEIIFPSYDVFLAIPPNAHPSISYNILLQKEIKGKPELNPIVVLQKEKLVYKKSQDPKFVNYKFLEDLGQLWIDKNYCIHIKIHPYSISKTNFVNKIDKFRIKISFKNKYNLNKTISNVKISPIILNQDFAKSLIAEPNIKLNSSDSWIDYSKSYVKIGVAEDAVYRITKDELLSLGVNATGINPKTFKMFLKGNEIPIYVKGETDLSFDNSDFIEFVGIRNMGGHHREVSAHGEPYNEYLGRYTDTTVYWLTWDGTDGKRVSIYDNGSLNATDTLDYYSQIDHYETNKWFDFSSADLVRREMPYWTENKTWHEGNLNVGIRNKSFNVSDVYPDKTLKMFIKFQDYASDIYTNAHLISLSLNSTNNWSDSVYIDKYQKAVLETDLSSSLLKDGKNNLKINSIATEATINTCIFDWYEIEYPRYLIPVSDSLDFTFDYLTNEQIKVVKIQSVSTENFVLWKYGNSYKKYNLSKIGSDVFFTDTLTNNDKFCFIDESKISIPKFYYLKQFKNLRNSENKADYVAITHKKFISQVEDYSNFISNSYNLTSTVVDIDDIYDEYTFGFFNPEAIKEFLKSTHVYWQNPKPQDVCLIGGATYDYFHNKEINFDLPRVNNYVPSFGAPVSDNWFVTWDTTGAYIPQMNIGRIPVKNVAELNRYVERHKSYVEQNYNEWNKNFMFFSGGQGDSQSELNLLRTTNEFIINEYAKPKPVGGKIEHFYKTINPTTNFGPYDNNYFQNAIDEGAVFISYIGHSGTRTWDNSITEPEQLFNSKNRSPLVTDYGCSTAKFAESDVTSFAELFVLSDNSQGIAYIGNSSLGFTSSATYFPKLFYKKILADTVYNVSEALKEAKIELLENNGSSEVYKLFTLTNTLIGDPLVSLPIPTKPNLSIKPEDVNLKETEINDAIDSMTLSIIYNNFGRVSNDSLSLLITDNYNNNIVYSKNYLRIIPNYADTINIKIPIKNKPGNHNISVILDGNNSINEIYEDDNQMTTSIFVPSSSIKTNLNYSIENAVDSNIVIFSPSTNTKLNRFLYQISTNSDFNSSIDKELDLDTIYTKIGLIDLKANQRYWFHTKITDEINFSTVKSFVRKPNIKYILNDSLGFNQSIRTNLAWYKGINVDTSKITLSASSAGFYDGRSALIIKSDTNFVPENYRTGHHIGIFDGTSLKFLEYKYFNTFSGGSTVLDEYKQFLDTLSNNCLILIAVSDDGRVTDAELLDKLHNIGSQYIDSLKFRSSWAIVGYKGAKQGSVPEAFSNPTEGSVKVDTSFQTIYSNGSLLTSNIGPSSKWKNLVVQDSLPNNSKIIYKPVLISQTDNSEDTLDAINIVNGIADLTKIDAEQNPYIKILAEFEAGDNNTSPALNSLGVDYDGVPELAINYQVVSVEKDTVEQGEDEKLSFYVYNVGESVADSFNVAVDVIKPDNSKERIFQQIVDSLGSEQRKKFNLSYNTSSFNGARTFAISIDEDNKILELYEDNNYFNIPFFVKGDTTHPTLAMTFDGEDIFDGEYISANPSIKIELNDPSLIPITDTSAVSIFLNNEYVSYTGNEQILRVNYSTTNPKVVLNYTPTLEDGEYTITVLGKDASGNLSTNSGISKSFIVMNEAKMLEVYNYPNPFNDNTYFTFKLTQIPDEIKIKVFTVAGRLVKEINLSRAQLNYDFNKIYWDGKDEDGDKIGNGVYLYKVIMDVNGKKQDITQKLAVVR